MAHLKLTPELTKMLAKKISEGVPICHACALCNISAQSVLNWKARAETGEEPFVSFVIEMDKARAKFIEHHINNIAEQGKLNWNASAWLLKITDPNTFGDKLSTTSENKTDVTITDYTGKSIPELEAELQHLLSRIKEEES